MTRRTTALSFAFVQLVLLTFFVVVAAPANAADKDCSDFATQKQAQIFFLNAGGPQQDPNYLDSDNDGIACEDNPCPCYYGTKPPADNPPATPPPPPAPVRSSLDLSANRTSGITGEKVRMVARVKPGFSRPIVLQRKSGSHWVKVVSGKTYNDGRWILTGGVARQTTTYRAAVSGVKHDGKTYTAATSRLVTIKALDQSLSLQLSDGSVVQGDRVVATVNAKPVRAGRPVVLQRRTSNGWAKVGTDKESRRGAARFVVPTGTTGGYHYRAVVQRFHGAVPFTSVTRDLKVSPPPDTTPPGVPTGLVATAGDGSVSLDWSDVAAADLRGYYVYYATSTGGPWTQLNGQPVGTSAYTASGLTNGTQYSFCVRSVDYKGNASTCSTSTSATPAPPPDTTAPDAPQGLTATAGDTVVDLDWSDVTAPDLAGYRVYVAAAADGPWTLLTTDPLTASAYRAEGLTNDTEYFFRVTAVDTAGNESAAATVSATPTAPAPAPAPEPAPAP